MPDPVIAPSAPLSAEQGPHYALIKQAIPSCLVNSSPERRNALKHTAVQIPTWYDTAPQAQKDQLKTLLQARCQSMNELEKSFSKVQSVETFAQPLLTAALKAAGHDLDIHHTWLRLYVPVQDAFGVRTGGFQVKTFSLLQAALANFEAREAEAGFFNSASGFITEPDARGHFDRHATSLTIHAFATLCRALDLGAQYLAHLKALLEPAEAQALNVFRERYISYQKDAFKAAAYLALLKGDIGASDHALLMRVAAGEQRIMIGKKQIWFRRPCLMNLHLHDCLIIDPCVKYRYSDWIIVYIPEDPEHPIKRYETFNAFANELADRLTQKASHEADRSKGWLATPNQRFFGQFVADKDRPYYYHRLTELVVDAPPQPFGAQWLRSEWGRLLVGLVAPPFSSITSTLGGPQSSARVPITAPNFNINADALNGLWGEVDLWPHRYDSLRERLYEDARNQAVSTADADEASRSRRISHYLSIGMFGLNLAAMAIPPLGVVMGAVMAGQILYQILEGAVELGEGDREAGWAHITDVVENLATLAAGAAVYHAAVSPFVEELRAVTLPSGKTRLWKPDLSPYEYAGSIPTDVMADEQGVYKVGGKSLLRLEGKLYTVAYDDGTEAYHMVHPSRLDAYRPMLTQNGSGLWNHEVERPLSWEGAALMRRLGPVTEGFSDTELEQVRRVADVSEDVLRRVHVDGEAVPAIVLDTLRQFRAYRDAVSVAEGIRQGALSSQLCSYAASLMVELPGWPASKAIEVFEGTELSGPSIKYGNRQATAADIVRIHRTDLMNGRLPERIVESLSSSQLDDLLRSSKPGTPQAHTAALQARLEKKAIDVRSRLMNSIYVEQQPPSDPAIMLVQRDFSGVPTILARELLEDATPAEQEIMSSAKRIPLRIAQKARLAQQQMRLTLAYEGLYLDTLAGPDTEALVLNSLQRLPGWTDNLRLEVREGHLEGALRASFGPPEAADRKVLVRLDEGLYQPRNVRDEDLHGIDDLYVSLQHALTDHHRQALGLPHPKQGAALKAKILEHALPREALRQVLKLPGAKSPFFRAPVRLSGDRRGYPLSNHGQEAATRYALERRIKDLYTGFDQDQVDAFFAGAGPHVADTLTVLEQELKTLKDTLKAWLREQRDQATPQVRASGEYSAQRAARRSVITALLQAWRRTGPEDETLTGTSQGQLVDLSGESLHDQLQQLPPLTAYFGHVSHLDLSGTELTDGIDTFLGYFKRLRRLNLSNNELVEVPAPIKHLWRLTELDLSDNLIELDAAAVEALRGLKRLNYLGLEGNPLGLSPDISQMPDLNILKLAQTGLTTWPTGIFEQERATSFHLDLRANRLELIPDVALGTAQSAVVARTEISLDPEFISAENLQRFKNHRASEGMDPHRVAPPRGLQESIFWREGLSEEAFLAKQSAWDSLEHEFGSEPFFNELRLLAESADATAEAPAVRAELTGKVWQMIEAAVADTGLRKKLFSMAQAPSACVDAGAQLFNAMGVEVLVQQAHGLPSVDLIQSRLLTLARGKSRLDALGKIAKARIDALMVQGRGFAEYDQEGRPITRHDADGNPLDPIDEVEVHLIYPTRLAQTLDLPWQSRGMHYDEPSVTAEMIEQARLEVLAAEEGPQLAQRILEQTFWTDFLRRSNPQPFDALRAREEALSDAVEAPEPISQAAYEAGQALIAADFKALFVSLTEQAIARAGWSASAAP